MIRLTEVFKIREGVFDEPTQTDPIKDGVKHVRELMQSDFWVKEWLRGWTEPAKTTSQSLHRSMSQKMASPDALEEILSALESSDPSSWDPAKKKRAVESLGKLANAAGSQEFSFAVDSLKMVVVNSGGQDATQR